MTKNSLDWCFLMEAHKSTVLAGQHPFGHLWLMWLTVSWRLIPMSRKNVKTCTSFAQVKSTYVLFCCHDFHVLAIKSHASWAQTPIFVDLKHGNRSHHSKSTKWKQKPPHNQTVTTVPWHGVLANPPQKCCPATIILLGQPCPLPKQNVPLRTCSYAPCWSYSPVLYYIGLPSTDRTTVV